MQSSISIGNNLARIRKERKLTQEDLASFLGVTKASVSKWETGQSYPDIELLADTAMPDMGVDIILARAYCALGQADKADGTLQAMIYQALILNLNRLTDLALLHAANPGKLGAIHERTLKLFEAFDLESSYMNIAATHLAFAMAYIMGGDADGAIGCLEDYERSCRALEFPLKLHGDGKHLLGRHLSRHVASVQGQRQI